jgi:hypothetical protein
MKNLKNIAPDYPRIPHLSKDISNMTHDDITIEHEIQFPFECFVQEKIDGANCGMSWDEGPILRNRNHILKKGYIEKNTPAKIQFRSAWNWLHKHEDDIKFISEEIMSPITVYGEWLFAKHSLDYNLLPDFFIAYDIWSVEDNQFIAPDILECILNQTDIKYVKSEKVIFNNINEIVSMSEMNSKYRNGVAEGIVLKTSNDKFTLNTYKVVNSKFKRREDFNDISIIKNKII